MKTQLINRYLSEPRYDRYLKATGNDRDRAERLYNANVYLAQAFHPVLSQFEVILRNSIDHILTLYFTDSDWILNQKAGFMGDRSLGRSHYFLQRSVQKAEDSLRRKAIPITSGKVISDQTFGFWSALFLSHHYSLLSGQPIQIFRHKPQTQNRASILSKLQNIRDFRNRVNHCEPLGFRGHNIDCSIALYIRDNLYELVAWMEPDLIPFFKNIDYTQKIIDDVMAI